MKYILLEKSAIEELINNTQMQSIEYDLCRRFILGLKEGRAESLIRRVGMIKTKDGILVGGKQLTKTFLLIDLEQCNIIEKCSDQELLTVLQKTFRFAVRFWNKQSFTSCEKIFKDRTVIFPFSFSANHSSNRIVIARNINDKRLDARGIKKSLFAYKYGNESTASDADEQPEIGNYRKGGEDYLKNVPELKRLLDEQDGNNVNKKDSENAIQIIESGHMVADSSFKYMNFENQVQLLTATQKKIVEYKDLGTPIKIQGPAGTGKTASMVLRAIRILKEASEEKRDISICFFTHSKSTETAVREMVTIMAEPKWLEEGNPQYIKITTLQDFCIKYIKLDDMQVIDLDASEAKQYQLLLIEDAYKKLVDENVLNTFKCLMSDKAASFFEKEEESQIVMLLQYEFSINIKGMSEGDLEKYKSVSALKNGIPFEKEEDKEFVYRVYKEYQKSLESQAVYDTDDIILETLARLNAPLWRRERSRVGIDYLFVDEMHLFNLNEQQLFHYLTKDSKQAQIPVCFALDYGQVIGERSDLDKSYIEKEFSKDKAYCQEFGTVFRSSQQIAELCASITASGALLFDAFINPYKYCESKFTAREEAVCDVPKLIMYEDDREMLASLEKHIKDLVNRFKCRLSEIALIFFDERLLDDSIKASVGKYSVNLIDGRRSCFNGDVQNKVVCSLPEYINGLEFSCVVLVGVDEGRVPQNGIFDISANFLRYSALNKLYLACSRAKYSVTVLGTNIRGISSCLEHSLNCQTIKEEKV